MKSISMLAAFAMISLSLIASEQNSLSNHRRSKSIDLTRDHKQCRPNIYKLGCKTLVKRGERYISEDEKWHNKHGHEILSPTLIYNIGSDEDAVRRWTIVAQEIIKADENDWYTDFFSPGAVRKSEYQARSLVRALKEKGMNLDDDTMHRLQSVDRLETTTELYRPTL